MTYHFAVDLGATSGRTILASFDGEKVDMQEVSRFKHPMLPIAGHIYWNLPELFHQVLVGLKKPRRFSMPRVPLWPLLALTHGGATWLSSTPTAR